MPQLTNSEPHVAVLNFPFGTHAAPVRTIINRLAMACPNTLFSFFNIAQSNNSLFSSQQTQPNIQPYNVPDGVPDGYVFAGKPQEDIELFMKAAQENLKKGVEVAVAESGRKLSCLVTDAFFWFGKEMAMEYGVPWLTFFASGASALSSHIYTDLLREKFGVEGIVGREDETLNFIPGMSDIRILDLPEGIISGNLDSIFSRMLHRMGQVLPVAAAVMINSFEEVDPVITNDLKSKLKRFLPVGPLSLSAPPPPAAVDDSYGCLAWLDKQKPATVAYIGFGSVAIPPPNELLALAEALEATRVPFVWSLRDKSKVHLPNGFIERANGIVVPWAPQPQVLAHSAVGVFFSHCGFGSVQESISGGVPMIGRPFFGDHKVNARMIEVVWQIGVIVKGGIFTKNGIMSCLDLVLAQEKGKQMRENLKALKELAHAAVGPQGSSTRNFKALLDLISSKTSA
ncbi:UDP-glucuronosyl/UDP-glucosyltransferase [Corchorus capsularis]|uniref:Glycosyltransferase n=1 Tax=Corchorus capsularis TaxID=210143 RepID=A0A1R3JU05_COCAP|nr:UDP-glucuronosyl/UDP-glucosyltransferase [Corchorus capsularis]